MSLNFVSSFGLLLFFALKIFRIFISSTVISAIGVSLIILKASRREVCIFRIFVAGIARQVLSLMSLCPISAISAMSDVAYFAAQIKFSAASVEARSMLLWEYVRAIGLFRFLMKNDNADAV